MSFAFFVDASGSMSTTGSAPGMPCLTALDIAVLLILTFYRATANYSITNTKAMPNHLIGYFGIPSMIRYGGSRTVNIIPDDNDIANRASPFVEVTSKLNSKTTFKDAKQIFGNGAHLGCTDVGSAFWCIISKLKKSIEKIKSKDPLYEGLTVFQLPGYAELMIIVTDNDVNSGDQPMDVLKIYWNLVKIAFQLIPLDKDNKKSDPDTLFKKYSPKLVVVATQGTPVTIGDPRDSRILNISGFDSSAPMLIDTFVNEGNEDDNITTIENKNDDDD